MVAEQHAAGVRRGVRTATAPPTHHHRARTRVFPDPDVVDPRRANAAKHLSFGGGLHHCLGAPLARVQLQEAVTGLVRRYSRIEPDGEASRYPSLIFPSLSTLPVRARA